LPPDFLGATEGPSGPRILLPAQAAPPAQAACDAYAAANTRKTPDEAMPAGRGSQTDAAPGPLRAPAQAFDSQLSRFVVDAPATATGGADIDFRFTTRSRSRRYRPLVELSPFRKPGDASRANEMEKPAPQSLARRPAPLEVPELPEPEPELQLEPVDDITRQIVIEEIALYIEILTGLDMAVALLVSEELERDQSAAEILLASLAGISRREASDTILHALRLFVEKANEVVTPLPGARRAGPTPRAVASAGV
jgi:hypothetical protein